MNHCPDLSAATAAATVTVDTWSFDLMAFMTPFLATVAQPGTERVEAQFALFFDESGEGNVCFSNRSFLNFFLKVFTSLVYLFIFLF